MGSIDAFSTGVSGLEALRAGRCVGVVRQKTHRKKSQRAGVFLFGEEPRFLPDFVLSIPRIKEATFED